MSIEEWAERMRSVTREAKADGFTVWISNPCCGCTRSSLRISPSDEVSVGVQVSGDDGE